MTSILARRNMHKRFVTSILALAVLTVPLSSVAFAQTANDKDAQRERDVQIFITNLASAKAHASKYN